MTAIGAFFALPRADKVLVARAAGVLIAVRVALAFVPFARVRRWAERQADGNAPAARVAWAVRAASRRLPGMSCLVTALAAQRLLSSAGHACELQIGVARQDRGLAAHAWVVCGGEVVVGQEERDAYTKLAAWRAEP